MTIEPFELYKILLNNFGNQFWWPVDEKYHLKNKSDQRFEVMIGAILTQNCTWTNVEKALSKLKENNLLEINSLLSEDEKILKDLIKSTGFFNQKTSRLYTLSNHLFKNYNCDIDKFFNRKIQIVRNELLNLNGIGPETADSIILYAGDKPIFVIDAYTKRICKRLPINTNCQNYNEIQNYFEKSLQKIYTKNIVDIYKQLHALIVELAKNYCSVKPKCDDCPVNIYCEKNLS